MSTRPDRFAGVSPRESAAAIAFAGFIALAVAMGIGRFAFTPILPMMQEEGGLSIADGGWLASANYVGYLLGALIAVGMRIQPAAAIRYGLVVIGLVTLGMGIDHRFAVWIVLRALAGIASAWVLIFVSAWCLEKLARFDRPILSSIVFSGVGSGIAVAGALCLALMHAKLGAAQAWITLGILSLVAAAAIWRVFQSHDDGSYQNMSAPADALRWDSESVRLVLCYGAFGFGYIIPATFLPVMAKQIVQDPAVFGWSWPAFGIAALVSTLAASILRKFIGSRRLWMACALVMALGVALPLVWSGIVGIILSALCVGGTTMVITMVGMQEAREVGGRHARSLMAAMTSAFAVGQIAGPVSVSYVAGSGGSFAMTLLVACVVLTISAFALSRQPGARASSRA